MRHQREGAWIIEARVAVERHNQVLLNPTDEHITGAKDGARVLKNVEQQLKGENFAPHGVRSRVNESTATIGHTQKYVQKEFQKKKGWQSNVQLRDRLH